PPDDRQQGQPERGQRVRAQVGGAAIDAADGVRGGTGRGGRQGSCVVSPLSHGTASFGFGADSGHHGLGATKPETITPASGGAYLRRHAPVRTWTGAPRPGRRARPFRAV